MCALIQTQCIISTSLLLLVLLGCELSPSAVPFSVCYIRDTEPVVQSSRFPLSDIKKAS